MENLNDHTGRFKCARDVLESQICRLINLTKYIEDSHVSNEGVFERYMTYLIMANANKVKIWFIDGWTKQSILTQEQSIARNSLAGKQTVLDNHKFIKQ